MAINRGVAPPDPGTDVGRVRLLSGDVDYVELVPPEVGFGNYSIWSDAQIEAALEASGGSIPRTIAMLYSGLAASWASTGATIRTDDLTYSVKDSVGNWLTLAAYWKKVADDEEERAINDYFDLVSVRGGDRACKPELAQWRACNCGLFSCIRCSTW